MRNAMLLASIVAISALLTWIICRSANRWNNFDVPNDRSSHTTPTPRSGGISFVVVFTTVVAILTATHRLDANQGVSLIVGGLIVAVTGFLDDRQKLSRASSRLFLHFVAATISVVGIGGLLQTTAFGLNIDLRAFGSVLAVVYLVWLLNLFNFMDGIDGICGTEVVSVCVGASIIVCRASSDQELTVLPLFLGVAVLGFLVFNWPPAKIFMGDVGSGFLGFIIGMLSLLSAERVGALLWVWIILLGVFIVDATTTLIRRIARGDRPHMAHRSHAYQHLALRVGSHRPVTVGVIVINVAWLLPIAFAVGEGWLDGAVGVLIAYTPLTVGALKLGAGTPTTNR